MQAILLAFVTGAATLAAVVFFILRRQDAKNTRRKYEIKNNQDRARIERNIAEHGEEVRRIMDKINRYKNVVVVLFFPLAAFGQPSSMAIPPLNYKDVVAINRQGVIMNHADSIVVINPERYRFYEGLIVDITNLNAHYEAIVAGKDSIIDLTAKQLRESDDLLNQCATDLESKTQKKGGSWLGATGSVVGGLLLGIIAVVASVKLL